MKNPLLPLFPPVQPPSRSRSGSHPSTLNYQPKTRIFALFPVLAYLSAGCQVLTYTGPNGEHFSRSSFASKTAISSLCLEATTNGVRKVQLKGYQNDSTAALGAVTEAAVRAALDSAK